MKNINNLSIPGTRPGFKAGRYRFYFPEELVL
jgi:hypothetical protein